MCGVEGWEGGHSLVLTLPPGDPFDADPPEDEHGAVVVDVEEADLVELLPQDEKDRVQEFDSFGNVVPPKGRCYLETRKSPRGESECPLLITSVTS